MTQFDGYHTALAEPVYDGPPVQSWSGNGHMAIAADVISGLPIAVTQVEAIYGEPPWRPGYDTFNERAGLKDQPSWGEWLAAYSANMRMLNIPACAMFGKQGLKHIKADDVLPIKLSVHRDFPVFLACWNGIEIEGDSTDAVSTHLAKRYGYVADLCCGFGRSSRLIAEAGGRFVAVDANAFCIGYISRNAANW